MNSCLFPCMYGMCLRYNMWIEYGNMFQSKAKQMLHFSYAMTDFFMMTSSNGNISDVTGPLCGNSPVTHEFPTQRPVTRSFDVFFDLRLNKWLSKQSWGWWFETPSRPLWRHSNVSGVTQILPVGKSKCCNEAFLAIICWTNLGLQYCSNEYIYTIVSYCTYLLNAWYLNCCCTLLIIITFRDVDKRTIKVLFDDCVFMFLKTSLLYPCN